MIGHQANPLPMSEGLGRDLVGLIRALILSGTFAPGEKVLPKDLQERFGVSHVPVREALRALEAEGLVVTTPRQSPRVAAMTMDELHEVYQLRRLLEPTLNANAVAQRSPDDIDLARRAHDHLSGLVNAPQQDIDAIMSAHSAYHLSLLRPGLQTVTRRTVENLWAVSERYVRMSMSAFHTDRTALADHKALLDAFVAGDVERMRRETAHHLELVETTTFEAISRAMTAPTLAPNTSAFDT